MGIPAVSKKRYTIAEWVALERDPKLNPEGQRFEYHEGEIVAMAGGTMNHMRIGRNALTALDRELSSRDGECEAMSSEIRIEIEPNGRYVYPDTLVVCGEVETSEHVVGSITNPTVVIEVMSESSSSYDLDEKFQYYSSLPSVQEYLVIAQDTPRVILFRRGKKSDLFTLKHYVGADTEIELKSIAFKFPLSVLYRNVSFEVDEEE